MTPRSRSQRARVASRLSERDWAVLHDLARVRLLTGRQVQRLHVAEGSALTQARRARAVLERLHDLRLVSRLERRIGGVRAGSAGYVYGLATLGQRLVTQHGPAGGRRLRAPWTPSPSFVDHVLDVSELYVRLRELERADSTIKLLAFDAEPTAWRPWQSADGEELLLKPDAFTSVAVDDIEYLHFVEVDRSTESSTVLRRKAEVYAAYWQSGTEQGRLGVFPRVLFVVPDERRYAQIIDALSRVDPDTWRLFAAVRQADAHHALAGRPPP